MRSGSRASNEPSKSSKIYNHRTLCMLTTVPYNLFIGDWGPNFASTYHNSVLNVKAVVAAFNQEKAGHHSVIIQIREVLFQALSGCGAAATQDRRLGRVPSRRQGGGRRQCSAAAEKTALQITRSSFCIYNGAQPLHCRLHW